MGYRGICASHISSAEYYLDARRAGTPVQSMARDPKYRSAFVPKRPFDIDNAEPAMEQEPQCGH
jgi:hypothetical protein